MNIDILTLIIFVIVLSIVVLINRKKVQFNKLLFPVLYIIMYRTRWGIPLMEKIARKNKNLVKLIGYCCIGIGWLGMLFISFNIILVMIRFLAAPKITETGMTLVFPGTTIPGIGYLSFWYWIISLFILAVVHEFSHGIVAKAHDLEIKSSGFAILGIIAPIFPAAFVEPDEKKLSKKPVVEQYSIFAAGPISNLVLALIFALIFFNVFVPAEANYAESEGFYVDVREGDYPAAEAGMPTPALITAFNGRQIKTWNELVLELNCVEPGDTIILGNDDENYTINTIPHPENENAALVGILNPRENLIKQETPKAKAFFWFKELFYWMFLLNFFVGLANLLPIFITDGARMLYIALTNSIKSKKTAVAAFNIINWLFLLLIIIGLLGNYLRGFLF